MNSWVWQSFLYDFRPSPERYLFFKWQHFLFCSNENPAITASLSIIQNLLQKEESRGALITLIEQQPPSQAAIKSFLSEVADYIISEGEKKVEKIASSDCNLEIPLSEITLFR